MTEGQKQCLNEAYEDHIEGANNDDIFRKSIIMDDEEWIYADDVETKARSSQ